MTHEQWNRWKDFSLRMARSCYRTHRRPDCKWIVGMVQDYFEFLSKLDGSPTDWVLRVIDWDHTDRPDEPEDCHGQNATGPPICDDLSSWIYDNRDGLDVDDDANDYWGRVDKAEEQWDKQYGGPVRCCIRAGLDRAVGPSMGVIGFTAGDIRGMYPEGVPEWVKNGDWDTINIKAVVPGIGFIPGEPHSPKPFDAIPDETVLCL